MNEFHIMTMNDCILFAQKVFEKIFITNECNILNDRDENFTIDEIATLDSYLLKFAVLHYGLKTVALQHMERFLVSLDIYHGHSKLLTITRSLIYSPASFHQKFLLAQGLIFKTIRQMCLSTRLRYRSRGRFSAKEREYFVNLFTQSMQHTHI
jgi:hypothetical protein